MSLRLVIAGGLLLLLVACSSPDDGVAEEATATCGGQTGMTGELAADLPGTWRLAWSGSADGGPSDMLIDFSAAGDAGMQSERFGRTEWSWSIDDNEVRMWNHEGDSQLFTTTWIWAGGEWSWLAIGYGTTELARCTGS